MKYNFKPMGKNDANAIAGWQYEGRYAFYDMANDPEDLAELLDPGSWENHYYAVTNEGEDLLGFFCFELSEVGLEVGLGLRPDLTGIGLGLSFLQAGLAFAKQKFHPRHFTWSVATFNQRAIKLYRQAGFEDAQVFINETNSGDYEFLRMVKAA